MVAVSSDRTDGGEQLRIAEELRRGNPDFIVMWGIFSRKYWARYTLTEGWIGDQDPREMQRQMDEIRRKQSRVQ